ncbi:hypothetical protein [Helicobacter cappadocius]|uniref:Uncharacterized protein n=1 Tax=Helicobacter cappadocius TaxID=3063998 RepID=A0AA90TAB5_9HELI|nr:MULTISPECIES: hypothetical protein [unclassified Helicobacter]MDO7253906.1 hypothetical protein [Helicobacter sp. faydin-H75]MDP2539767.1 hypothetical protein [Helicobacter sp. faydin-H76]
MIVSTKELGGLLGLTERHIYNLEKNEVLAKEDKNCWDAYKNIQSYITYKVSTQTNTTDSKEARTRKDIADAKLKEAMLAEKMDKLIPIEKVAKELEDIAIIVSNKLYSIPHNLKKRFKLEDGLEKLLEKEIENTLKELKDPDIYTQKALEIEEKQKNDSSRSLDNE